MATPRSLGRREFLLAVLAAAASGSGRAHAGTVKARPRSPARFVQDRFCISACALAPEDAQTEERYAQFAAANFNVVMGGFGARTPTADTRQLDLCQKHGLKAIVYLPGYWADGRKVAAAKIKQADRFPDHPACWGYNLCDEPNSRLFPYLGRLVSHLRKVHPGRLGFINLLPTYADDAQLGERGPHSYDTYVADFMRQVNPDVLCMDYYPYMQPGHDTRDGYRHNLAILRKHALAAKIPFWNYFNDMVFGQGYWEHYDPTAAQIRWQIYTSLAYGAKGVIYFCYWTPGWLHSEGVACVASDGRLTHHYAEARRINAKLKNLGPTLMRLTSTAVYRVPRRTNAEMILKGAPLALDGGPTPGDYLIGIFSHADGRTAVLLNNYSYTYAAWPTVRFAVRTGQVSEVAGDTGKEIPLQDDDPAMPGTQVWLAPGEGRLFLFQQ